MTNQVGKLNVSDLSNLFLMKNLLMLFLFSTSLCYWHCQKTETPSGPFDGNYAGVVTIVKRHWINSLLAFSDTSVFSVTLKIEEGKFWKDLGNGLTDCPGRFSTDSTFGTMRFWSSDCACMCDCKPNVDCEGDPVLGTFQFLTLADTLQFISSGGGSDSVQGVGGAYSYEWYLERRFQLVKQ